MGRLRQSLANQGWYQKLSEGKYAFYTLLSPRLNTCARWKQVYGQKIDLKHPVGFCEKLMWLKLYAYNGSPVIKRLAHKVLARDYVKECGCEATLNEIYGVWDAIDAIPFDRLPEQFILKTAMGCGSHVLCRNKAVLNEADAKQTLKNAWSNSAFLQYAEMQYRPDRFVRQQVLAERLLNTPGGKPPEDYKFYCYHGEPLYVLYCFNRRADGHADFMIFDRDWAYRPELTHGQYPEVPQKPRSFDRMLTVAKRLAGTFPFVRVDLYEEDGKPIFGELTFTPSGGLDLDYTELGQRILGEPIDLDHIDYEALQ